MTLTDLAAGTLALILLVLPGWMAARAARVPCPLLAGFIAGVVAMTSLVLALDGLSMQLTLIHCGVPWLVLGILVAWICRKKTGGAPALVPVAGRFAWRDHAVLFIALIPAIAVVVYRAGTQPLFGIDTIFRWNYLAEQMLARGTLHFYPPVTAADYEIYAWPDGIAPAVSSLYFWAYALGGGARPPLTSPLVIFEFCLLVFAAFALARQRFSDRAAAFACALLGCSPVVAWATAMGQETGLTAIALAAMLLYLPRDRTEETDGAAIFAGLAAGLGALAREYGIAFALVGVGLILARRLSWRAFGFFAGAAALSALPWYLRNWVHTGNPLFNLDVHGWFPINREHDWLNQSYQVEFGWKQVPSGATRFIVVNCLAAIVAGGVGAALYFRRAAGFLAAIVVIVLLWAVSVGYTAAGFTYAIRVLSPALVLASVLGGAAGARWVPGRRHLAGVTLALTLFGADAALRALTMPGNVYKIPPADWLEAGGAVHEYHSRPVYGEIARFARGERILVLGPNALLARQGARTLPPWSPEVQFLFDETISPAETAKRLRTAGVGFVLLNRGPANERYLAHSRFFRDPAGTLQLVWSDQDMILHRVIAPQP